MKDIDLEPRESKTEPRRGEPFFAHASGPLLYTIALAGALMIIIAILLN